jgi:hypothetical protein
MKLMDTRIASVAVAVLLGITHIPAQAGWYFANTGRTSISNEVGWVFTVVPNTSSKTVTIAANACTLSPPTAGTLDFSGGVSDDINGSGDTYHIVAIGAASGNSILGANTSLHIPKASGLVLPNTLSNLVGQAFHNCTNLTGSLVIPTGVTNIGANVFRNCGFSGSLAVPANVKTLGNHAFSDCKFNGALSLPPFGC